MCVPCALSDLRLLAPSWRLVVLLLPVLLRTQYVFPSPMAVFAWECRGHRPCSCGPQTPPRPNPPARLSALLLGAPPFPAFTFSQPTPSVPYIFHTLCFRECAFLLCGFQPRPHVNHIAYMPWPWPCSAMRHGAGAASPALIGPLLFQVHFKTSPSLTFQPAFARQCHSPSYLPPPPPHP